MITFHLLYTGFTNDLSIYHLTPRDACRGMVSCLCVCQNVNSSNQSLPSENTTVLRDAESRFIPPTCYVETSMLTQKCFLMNAWIGLINGPISITGEA